MRKVAIVGGGFGGLAAAHELRGLDVEVTLVDRMHHHLFQPLLYQVAGGGLAAGECAEPIRTAVGRNSNTTVLMAEATGLDAEKRTLTLDDGEQLGYDSLIVACGARTSYFGHDEWQNASCGLKTLKDALDMRNRIYAAFERAERAHDPTEQREWMTFVVIGGGPTGVEIAGELALLSLHGMKRGFRNVDPRNAKVILLDAGERLTAAFSERLSGKVATELASLGVSVREGTRVTGIDERGVTVAGGAGDGKTSSSRAASQKDGEGSRAASRADGEGSRAASRADGEGSRAASRADGGEERIEARTVIWAAGVEAVPFAGVLAKATGAKTDRAGRVEIDADLTVAGHPEISAIGDATSLKDAQGKPYPGLATVAIQQGRHVAKGIARGAAGANTPFRYFDKGALAVVGRGRAVCEIRGHELSGRIAFMTYLTVHMYYLGGVKGNRLKVLIDWAGARLGFPENQVIEDTLAKVEP